MKKSEERSYTEQNVRDALRYILGQLHLNQTTISPATAITKCGCEGLRMARTVPAPPRPTPELRLPPRLTPKASPTGLGVPPLAPPPTNLAHRTAPTKPHPQPPSPTFPLHHPTRPGAAPARGDGARDSERLGTH